MKNESKIVHIISSLGDGGAEGALYRLVINDKSDCKHEIVSFISGGKYSKIFKSQDIKVTELNQVQGKISFLVFIKLFRYLSNVKPDVVQTWMYHADLIGGVIAKIIKIKHIVWNVRTSFLTGDSIKFSTKVVVRLCSFFSKNIPDKIITCSNNAALFHKSIGYKSNFITIDNGFDKNKLYPSKSLRSYMRKKISVSDDTFLIGMIARFDPQKDHENAINALTILKKSTKNFKCIFVGKDMDNSNSYIKNLLEKFNLVDNVILFGQSININEIMNAIDLHILSSSYGEGFPNVVAEAMMCGTPCIVTNVGDSSRIVGNTGWVVEPNDSNLLSKSIENAIQVKSSSEKQWDKKCKNVANKAKVEFTIERMVSEYHKAWFGQDDKN
ncbi:glycosyltransferase [Candidatus Thioglobus sp.]|nr:glycosyltransferase [Candidatus Thioglobus sp.]